jgi:hypothetical protein
VFPYKNLPAIHSFCVARLEEFHAAGDEEAPKLRARLETAVHALRALDPDTWWQAEDDIRGRDTARREHRLGRGELDLRVG